MKGKNNLQEIRHFREVPVQRQEIGQELRGQLITHGERPLVVEAAAVGDAEGGLRTLF
jgi:hypothetical protein